MRSMRRESGNRLQSGFLNVKSAISEINLRMLTCKQSMRFSNFGEKWMLTFVSSRKYEITKGLYGIFHGRLATTILSHYDNIINSIEIDPQLNPQYDIF